MITIGLAITINQPVERVFEFVSDMRNGPAWLGTSKSEKVSVGPIGVGSRFDQQMEIMGKNETLKFEYLEFEPPTYFSYKYSSSFFTSEDGYEFEAVEGGTRLVYKSEMEFSGMARFGSGFIEKGVKKQQTDNLKKLKQALEQN
jgi:uncharacterized protein YndB with AHSA1/START domain